MRLGKNMVGDSGLHTLVDYGLVRNDTLTVLDLRCNRLTGACADALTKLLACCPSLEELCLSHNKLGDEGAMAAAKGLERNETLTWLELSHNGISDSGLCEIALSLAENATNIQQLALWGNAFGPMAARSFLAVLSEQEIKTDFLVYADDTGVHVANQEL